MIRQYLQIARMLSDHVAQLAAAHPGGVTLHLEPEDVNPFLVAINDYRLLQAARHDIGEAEMDLRTEDALQAMAPARRAALIEIHFLAWVIEELLHALPGA